MSQTIAIAGATGFVGRALLQALGSSGARLIALSRAAPSQAPTEAIEWRSCNLFNLLHTERALQGADVAFYLVHSMMPQAALTQGHFADMDLICADNFARAARRVGVKHIVYLGGIIPQEGELSAHLRSRYEVEGALASHGIPVTTLRAGLIIGPGGSSFRMMMLLVRRLRVMLTPSWTQSRTQPVALRDVIDLLLYALKHPDLAGRAYDIGGPDILTYAELMQRTAEKMGKQLHIFTVPVESLRLSLLWVSLITQTPRQLVLPLVQSLRHSMIAHDNLQLQQAAGLQAMTLDAALHEALHGSPPAAPAAEGSRAKAVEAVVRTVVSVQRLSLPHGADAAWVAQEYARWLPQFLWPWLRVRIEKEAVYRFHLPFAKQPLLELTLAPGRSSPDRQLFYISGGLLARLPQKEPGRFEFRSVLNQRFVLSAVHDFVPRLPWYLYKWSQALAHRFVMYFFGKHLARISEATYTTDAAGQATD